MLPTIALTDSYKLTHWNQYPKNTEVVYSYLEAREGATYSETTFFGLYPLLKQLEKPITKADVLRMDKLANIHFGRPGLFNKAGWMHIVNKHKGRLPLRIRAVPEGSVVPVGNVLATVENTDPECFWLTNYVETLLSQVWYPSTVATVSRNVKSILKYGYEVSVDPEVQATLDFMLHDFGCRGATSMESAAIGGLAHLLSFRGTDTVPALLLGEELYNADPKTLGFSVPATEHSIMTARGADGEGMVLAQLLEEYPTGILSVVADSYNIYNFVENLVAKKFKDDIISRSGLFVIRPDSTNNIHATAGEQLVALLEILYEKVAGGYVNKKGYKVINPKIKLLWGDGLDYKEIETIIATLHHSGFSLENIATFGMGGGLLQKVNRDTQRFAFKCSAQLRGGVWVDVVKNPIGSNKTSKAGRLSLVHAPSGYKTMTTEEWLKDWGLVAPDVLQRVFENGRVLYEPVFDEIRARCA